MENILLDDLLNNCSTGDIILYNTQCWYSRLIEYWSGSIYSHIGIILKDPVFINSNLKGTYLLESSYEDIPDSNTGNQVWGVQIIPLDYVINQYKSENMGNLYYRKLNIDRTPEFFTKLGKCVENVEGDKYNLNPVDWCKAYFNINKGDTQKKNTFWCSALVGYIYSNLGILCPTTPWTILQPKAFSYYENNKETRLNYIDCKLHPEKKILF
tara:strand:- start:301 stop:936 length:636 start_codon:yes stop_codon:yes gene_type:complete